MDYEIKLYQSSHEDVLKYLYKADCIFKTFLDDNGKSDLKVFFEFIINKNSREAMKVDWVLNEALTLKAIIEIRKIRENFKENPFDGIEELNQYECDIISIDYPSSDDATTFNLDFQRQAWAWNSFRGTVLDVSEPAAWGEELIQDNLKEHAFDTLFSNISKWKQYSYLNHLKYNRIISKWMYGWKYIIPWKKSFSENDGIVWLKKVALMGNAKAKRILAGTFPDWSEDGRKQRAYWYLQAAELGDTISEEKYAQCCMDGSGVHRDPSEGLKWLRRAADKGMSTAQTKLAYELLNGKDIDQDFNEAVVLLENVLKKPSGNYDEFALRLMGACYKNGYGVEKNVKLAAEYFSKAAELGDLYSMYILSICLSDGDGIEKNLEEAYYWILKIGIRYNHLPDFIEFIEYSKKIKNEISIEDKEKAEKRAKK